MKYILKLLGFPVVSLEREADEYDILALSNVGGQFELAPAEDDDLEYEEYDEDFGFRSGS